VTGVTLFKLDEGVDTGPILAQERLLIAPDETATTLYERVAEAHRVLMRKVWPDLLASRLELVAQDDTNATEWPGRTPEDGRILPDMTVVQVDRLVRATTRPYPGAFWVEGDKVIRIWRGVKGDSPQTAPEGAYRLCLADGHYDALDYQYENGTNP
jgi:methionyl-tRNA formyltransferase